MSDIAIRVENLGKQYRIGAPQARYRTIRETVMDAVQAPFRRAGRLLRGEATGVSARGETIWALKDVSFEVKQGEVVGVIGRNGAGKSTLLKILSRITEPSTGYAEIHGRVGSLLEVGTGFHPELTGRENISLNGAILGMSRADIARKFDEMVAFAEVERFIDTPVKHYSSGMYLRLAFAVAAHLEPEILVVDEVLAVGDAQFQKKCLGKMGEVASEGRTVLFVSHNMAAVERLCSRGVFLHNGAVLQHGSVDDTITAYLGHMKSNEVYFRDRILRRASVVQQGSNLVISADYVTDRALGMPCLGFVISDYLGNPICGTNPVVDAVDFAGDTGTSGTVTAELQTPKLLNGTYRMSLWFGDGKNEYFAEEDALAFEVVNMTDGRQLPASSVGSVSARCTWSFT